jgi:hypothetical protein
MRLLLAFALAAFAQPPGPEAQQQEQPPAPAASTETAPAPAQPPVEAAPPPPPPKPVKLINVKIHPDSKDWEPVSLGAGGSMENASSRFSRRLKKKVTKGEGEGAKPVVTFHGENSKAISVVRVHKSGEDAWVIASVYPAVLKKANRYMEARFKITEGFLEEAVVAAVTVRQGQGVDIQKEDSVTLRRRGVSFAEDFPASARATITAISAKAGGLNAGGVGQADFADKELRLTSFGWNAKAR